MYFFTVFPPLLILSLAVYFLFAEEEIIFFQREEFKNKALERRNIPFNMVNSEIFENDSCKFMELNDRSEKINKNHNQQIICGRVQKTLKDEEESLKEILLLIEMLRFFKNPPVPFLSKKFLVTKKTEFRRENFLKKIKNFDPKTLRVGDSVCVSIEGETREIMKIKRYNLLWIHKFKSFKKKMIEGSIYFPK